jgi:hypothetical protein
MNIRLGILALSTPLLVASMLVATAPAAQAAACKPSQVGKQKYTTGSKKFTWVVAQRDREENFSGRSARITFEASKGQTQTNAVSVSSSLRGSVGAMWADFEASVGAEVGSTNSKTEFNKVTRTYTLANGDSYIFGQGTGRWTARTTVYRCSKANANGDGYVWKNMGAGTMRGHTGKTHSVVGCKQRPSSSSFAYVLKKNYC